jgi:subtilase family serine protease
MAHGYTGPRGIRISGSQEVRAFIDSRRELSESNERNNTKRKTILCKNIYKKTYDIETTDLYLDENCILWVKFTNKGSADINQKLHFKLWVNGRLVRDNDMLFDNFESGKWRSHGFTGVAPIKIKPSAVVKASVDTTHILPETNEINNTKTEKLICKTRYKK